MECEACRTLTNRYFKPRNLSGFTPSTYGGITAAAEQINKGINWHQIIESAITGILVAVVSTYLLKAIKA